MKSRIFAYAGTLAGCLALAGCSLLGSARKKPDTGEVSPRLVGRVAYVHESMGFVLVDTGERYSPTAGAALKTFRDGAESGSLAVSAERRRPYVAADVTSGAPQKGDAVYE